jgi:PKD repeat protein
LYGTINVYTGTGDYLGEIPDYQLSSAFAIAVSKSNILYVTQIGKRAVKRFGVFPSATPPTPPITNFSGTPLSGSAPLTVDFANFSTGFGQTLLYEWDLDYDGTIDSTDENPSKIYTDTGTYSVKLTASDVYGSSILTRTEYVTVSIQNDLTVSKTGGGTGTVNSLSTGIDCGGDCSESYPEDSVITLKAVADAGSVFAGWSGGGCSGTGECVTTVNAHTSVTAAFDICSNYPVRTYGVEPAYYPRIEDAYGSAVNGDTIQVQDVRFTSMPDMNADKTVTIEGGYSCDYLSNHGYTLVPSSSVTAGTVTISDFIFE